MHSTYRTDISEFPTTVFHCLKLEFFKKKKTSNNSHLSLKTIKRHVSYDA